MFCIRSERSTHGEASGVTSDLETFNREMASLLGTPVYPVIGESFVHVSYEVIFIKVFTRRQSVRTMRYPYYNEHDVTRLNTVNRSL